MSRIEDELNVLAQTASGDVKRHGKVCSNGVEMSFLALLAGFGSPDLFSTSCHVKALVASAWTLSGRRLGIDVLPGCGHPHLSRRVRKTPSMPTYLFPSLGLTNFGWLGECNVERSRAIRGSFTFGIRGSCHYLLVHALHA